MKVVSFLIDRIEYFPFSQIMRVLDVVDVVTAEVDVAMTEGKIKRQC